MAQGIGAQDNDRIEMHNEAGTFTATAGWVWAECLRESAAERRETYDGEHGLTFAGEHDFVTPAERERGIPASWLKS